MADFDARAFPFIFECDCGREQPVSRRECMDYASHMSGQTGAAAEFVVRSLHGWSPVDRVSLQCPDCATEEDELTETDEPTLFDGAT
jgi:hypothetical protein